MTEGALSGAAWESNLQDAPVFLHQYFQDAARRWPHRTAVEIPPGFGRPERQAATYAELQRQADAVADSLRSWCDCEPVAAILLPRDTPWTYSAQLGILQSGAAYTCIDEAFPDGRVRETLEDAAAAALVTDASGAARARRIGYAGQVLAVEDLGGRRPKRVERPEVPDPARLAYLTYTSGTTGRPKGVEVEHRSIANLVASDREEFRLAPQARVAQNSSMAYDSSVEEIWLAFAAGATLVVMDDDAVRLGPDVVPWLRRERITVFCPAPTLLRSMGGIDPEAELPDLAMIYSGGEALPQDLADRWSRNKLLVNGYGPTECSVTALRTRIRSGEPVSIGRPIQGIQAWVLNDALEEAGDGQWGELCVGGIGVARGYHNRPEQTKAKFIVHPRFGRLYRTGDLVHRDPHGDFFFHGRADSQVKVRGYRIELEEIEMRLAAFPGVRAAACTVQDEALTAYIVPAHGYDPQALDALAAALRETLPEYMIPSRFGILPELPLTVGGKLDRRALPRLDGLARAPAGTAPRNPSEVRLAETVRAVLELGQPPAIDADFFTILGGNSLRAAQLVTRLREDDPGTPVTVRDIYECRTVETLAARIAQAVRAVSPSPSSSRETKPKPAAPIGATMIQAAWLLAIFSTIALVGCWGLFDAMPWIMRWLGLIPALLLGPIFFAGGLALYAPLAVAAAATVKRILIGRYRPLRAPVWGSFYVRNWMVERVVHLIPWRLLEGTGFQAQALRALGARIGRRVHIHRGVELRRGGWDLLEIGDDVTLGQDAIIGLVELEDGEIAIRPVFLGNGATLETRAGVAGCAVLEPGAQLSALSWLPPGGRIPAGERWDGIPARPAGAAPPLPTALEEGRTLSPRRHDLLMILARCGITALPALFPEVALAVAAAALGIDAQRVEQWLENPTLGAGLVLSALALASLSVPVALAFEALLARGLAPVREGMVSRWSLTYLRARMKTELLEAAGNGLAGTLFWPVWLRGAGMRVGRRCEISTILDTVPDLVEIGDGTFLADGIYLGGPRIDRGVVTLARTRLGSRVYLGNHVVVPAGRRLPNDELLGVCTVAEEKLEGGGAWFGHPPFALPRREVVPGDPRMTYHPTPLRYATRLFWEILRFALPAPFVLTGLLWVQTVSAAEAVGGWARISATVCLASLGVEAFLCLLAVAAKWALVGKVRPGLHAFWACWCGRWDYMYVTWEAWAHPIVAHLEGTLLLNWFLCAMGVRMGRRVVLGPGFAQVVDPDMLIIGDGATVNAMFQAHTFEDRMLKLDYVRVGSGATLGTACVPLYGANIGAGAHLAPNSVVMKQERLLPGRRYEGAPARVEPGLDPEPHAIRQVRAAAITAA